MKQIILLLLLLNTVLAITLNDYCSKGGYVSCVNQCVIPTHCGKTKTHFQSLDREERQAVLEKHNEIRNEVAGGKYAEFNLPPAANMKALSYDKECEFLAGCYINRCIHEVPIPFIKSMDKELLGSNFYKAYLYRREMHFKEHLNAAIDIWFKKERLALNLTQSKIVSLVKFFEPPKTSLNFTQLLWADTEYVGCAGLDLMDEHRNRSYILTCNYKPAGNIGKGIMYKVKKSDDDIKCRPNIKYQYLCGDIREDFYDNYTRPTDYLSETVRIIDDNNNNNGKEAQNLNALFILFLPIFYVFRNI